LIRLIYRYILWAPICCITEPSLSLLEVYCATARLTLYMYNQAESWCCNVMFTWASIKKYISLKTHEMFIFGGRVYDKDKFLMKNTKYFSFIVNLSTPCNIFHNWKVLIYNVTNENNHREGGSLIRGMILSFASNCFV